MRRLLLKKLCLLLLQLLTVSANVEKIIFLGPVQTNKSDARSNVDGLPYDVLTPSKSVVRKELKVTFPSADNLWKGSEFWVLLDGLRQGERYEVRICWSATVCKVSIQRLSPPAGIGSYLTI